MPYQTSFTNWLSAALPLEKPPGIVAYNFNISETLEFYVVEICGARQFDPADSDWACEESWTSRPSEFEIPIKEAGNWEAVLDIVVDMVREFMSGANERSAILTDARAVAVGFVDGELIVLPQVVA